MGKTALVFPGQGTQHVGMGRELYQGYQVAREVFDEAAAILKIDLPGMCFDGPKELLDLTQNTQLAVLACNLAAYRVLASAVDIKPFVMAGHSVGEYAALAASRMIDFAEVFPLVRDRARYHQEAVAVGAGGMIAIMGMAADELSQLCLRVGDGEVFVSIFNAPAQLVISGRRGALQEVARMATSRAGVKAIELPISVPCHCGLLASAAEEMRGRLGGVDFYQGVCRVIPNCSPELFYSPDGAPDLLRNQIVQPVRWQETIERMALLGVDTVIELGPRRTLVTLIKRINPNLRTLFVEDRSSLEKTMRCLNG